MASKSVSVAGPVDIESTAKRPVAATEDLSSQRLYHGTRVDLKPGDLIAPGYTSLTTARCCQKRLYRPTSCWRDGSGEEQKRLGIRGNPGPSSFGSCGVDESGLDRKGARNGNSSESARARRRGDRMSAPGKAGAIQPVEVRPK
jgi:hypothetical protein